MRIRGLNRNMRRSGGAQLSLTARAIAAIRRAGGTVLAAGAATPVLGVELLPSTNLTTWVSGGAFGNLAGTTATVDTITTTGANGARRMRVACQPNTTYWFSVKVTGGTGPGVPAIAFGTSASAYISMTNGSGGTSGTIGVTATSPSNAAFLEFIVMGGTTGQTCSFAEFRAGVFSGYTYGNPPVRNYFDSAGTDILDSVTQVDQPVGLGLDGAGSVGDEKCPNGTFDSGATDWIALAGWVIGSGVVTATATSASFRQASTPLTAGKTYLVEFDYTHTSGTLYVRVGAGPDTTFSSSGRKSAVLKATTPAGVEFYGGAVTGVIDNISVRELTGNHATQGTIGSKPTLRRGLVNQLLWSGDFSNAVWTASKSAGATIGALTTGPDGRQSARSVTFTASSDYLYQGFPNYPVVTGQSVTVAFVCNGATRAFSWGGSTPAGTDVFASYDMGGGFWLQTLTRTFTVTTSALTLQVLPGLVAGTFAYHRAALYQGTVTAQQILDAGGIPLTTTAPASSALGNYWWQFSPDAPGDFLQTGITTGNEGWVCAGVNFADANVTFFSSGTTAANAGVWLYRNVGGAKSMNLAVANGSAIAYSPNIIPSANTPVIVSGGWTATTVFAGVDNTETATTARGGPSASTLPLRIGMATDGSYMLSGAMSVTVICPTLPPSADRALIRAWVAKQQGQTL